MKKSPVRLQRPYPDVEAVAILLDIPSHLVRHLLILAKLLRKDPSLFKRYVDRNSPMPIEEQFKIYNLVQAAQPKSLTDNKINKTKPPVDEKTTFLEELRKHTSRRNKGEADKT
jgi:hypothetical protein